MSPGGQPYTRHSRSRLHNPSNSAVQRPMQRLRSLSFVLCLFSGVLAFGMRSASAAPAPCTPGECGGCDLWLDNEVSDVAWCKPGCILQVHVVVENTHAPICVALETEEGGGTPECGGFCGFSISGEWEILDAAGNCDLGLTWEISCDGQTHNGAGHGKNGEFGTTYHNLPCGAGALAYLVKANFTGNDCSGTQNDTARKYGYTGCNECSWEQ